MRSTTLVAALLIGAVAGLAAQRAHQLELGGFGSFTRFDHLMALDPRIGAGARIGYASRTSWSSKLNSASPSRTPGTSSGSRQCGGAPRAWS